MSNRNYMRHFFFSHYDEIFLTHWSLSGDYSQGTIMLNPKGKSLGLGAVRLGSGMVRGGQRREIANYDWPWEDLRCNITVRRCIS